MIGEPENAAKEKKEVSNEFDILGTVVEQTEISLTNLEKVLSPIVHPQPPVEADCKNTEPCLVQVAYRIWQLRQRVSGMREKIEYLTECQQL